jgi:hypothetical protein
MQQLGRRVYVDERGSLRLAQGDYGQEANGVWSVRPPGCHAGGIPDHTVVEHADKTITVSPSIFLEDWDGKGGWHGFLEHGVWRSM